MISGGLSAASNALVPEIERATGNKVITAYGPSMGTTVTAIPMRLERGEPADVLILVGYALGDLIKQGKLVAATRSDFTRSGAGVAIKKGAAKPDLSSAEGFKRTLLAAKSIAYVGQGATGVTINRIIERFGIAAEMKAKTIPLSGISAADAVAMGEAELGFTQISEILPVAGAELAGPLPPEVQVYTVFTAAVGGNARDSAAAISLIKFLTAPAAAPVIRAKGMEPG